MRHQHNSSSALHLTVILLRYIVDGELAVCELRVSDISKSVSFWFLYGNFIINI